MENDTPSKNGQMDLIKLPDGWCTKTKVMAIPDGVTRQMIVVAAHPLHPAMIYSHSQKKWVELVIP